MIRIELVQYGNDGKVMTVRYHLLSTMLLNEVQKQQRLILSQKGQISEQARQNASQSQRINSQEQLIKLQAQQNAVQSQQISDLEIRLRRLERAMTRSHGRGRK